MRFLSTVKFPEVTVFPTDPEPGSPVFKDGILYVFADIAGVRTWFPLNAPQSTYVHTQETPALIWTINHNLGNKYVVVLVYNQNNEVINASVANKQVVETGEWYCEVTMFEPTAGYAMVVGLENISAPTINAQNLEVGNSISVAGIPVATETTLADAFNDLSADIIAYTEG